ncbi:hypothetical protein ABIC32_001435 [Brevundimonas sp. 1080]|uniref:DUF2840 domain-containing protein n=1 Tax=Brevundimonas sp. 1080 TaxID=3156405 RepID=UPI003397C030
MTTPVPPLKTAPRAVHDPERLTWVEVRDHHTTIGRLVSQEWSVPFGAPIDQRILTRRHRLLGFGPGAVFAYLRRVETTSVSVAGRLDILQVAPARDRIAVPGVIPGAAPLLRAATWNLARSVLARFSALEALGFPLHDIEPDYWRRLSAALVEGRSPPPYDRMRHIAWLAQRAAQS